MKIRILVMFWDCDDDGVGDDDAADDVFHDDDDDCDDEACNDRDGLVMQMLAKMQNNMLMMKIMVMTVRAM